MVEREIIDRLAEPFDGPDGRAFSGPAFSMPSADDLEASQYEKHLLICREGPQVVGHHGLEGIGGTTHECHGR